MHPASLMHPVSTRPRRIMAAAVLAFIAALILTPNAWASEQINSFDVQIEVQSDGSLSIIETIEYDFGNDPSRGIIRDIPLSDELPDGNKQVYGVTDVSVTANGAPVPIASEEIGPYLSVRIGDPDVTVTGVQEYRISYRVSGALTVIDAADISSDNPFGVQPGDVELFWDLIGTEWEVRIDNGTASVTGPGNVIASRCFTGVAGSTQQCPTDVSGTTATFGPVSLSPAMALTGGVAYPRAAFTSLPEPTIVAGSGVNTTTLMSVGLPIALLALAAPPIVVLILRRRLKGAEEPLAPVRFAPPDNLRPAEITAGLEGSVDARATLATLIDLVARRWITLASVEGRFFGKDSLLITWLGEGTDQLTGWENELLSAVLKGQPEASLKGYDAGLVTAVNNISKNLTAAAVATGRFNKGGTRNRSYVRGLIFLGIIILGAALVFGFDSFGGTAAVILAMFGGGLALGGFIGGFLVPRKQTASSAKFAADAEGFKRFLDTDPGAARRDLAQRLDLPDYAVYATMLPYAIIFDLESSWSGAFPDLTEEDLHRSGFYVANTYVMSRWLDSSLSNVQTASTTPSRSGGSSFGGGGSAGGGGGGGGGRSW